MTFSGEPSGASTVRPSSRSELMLTKARAGSAPGRQPFQAPSGYGRAAPPSSTPSIGPGHLGPATNTRPDCTSTAFQIIPVLSAATAYEPGPRCTTCSSTTSLT
ncbi:MAG TPA: hypothetical protein VNP03_28060 [Pseudonocardia sp.]|nr:hypothetical protein [Pseudonocardia sp.]